MSDFVKANQVFFDNPAKNVEETLQFLSKKAIELGVADDEAAVLAAFHAREEEGSTGMVDGFAIPHAKTDAIKEAAVFVVRFAGDVEWESMDGEPIRMAIALLVPDQEAGTTHLKLLSQVAVMLMDEDFRATALASSDPATLAADINARLG